MKEVSRYHHGSLREELLSTALKILDEDGIEAIGIRSVAKRVGVAHSAPANHFKNKAALLTAINKTIALHLIAAVRSKLDTINADSDDSIHQFSRAVLEYGLKYPNRYRLIWRSELELDESMDEIYNVLTQMLQKYADQKNVDVQSQAIALWSLIHGYVALRLDGHMQVGHDELTGLDRQTAIINVILDGIR